MNGMDSAPRFEYVGPGTQIGISSEGGFLSGHGTRTVTLSLDEEEMLGQQHVDLDTEKEQVCLVSTLSGFVERVNKLVSVRPLKCRYAGDVGDVVVGRITAVEDKKWKVDVNGLKDAQLSISAIHLPDGIQRRRTQEDALAMRNFFKENDLISAEVQKIYHHDGSIALHTRSLKYGKLEYGCFVKVTQSLVKRCKQHFVELDCGVFMILGNNGYIWLAPLKENDMNDEIRENISRVRNSAVALDRMFVGIWPQTIMAVYNESLLLGLRAHEILLHENIPRLTQSSIQISASSGSS